MYHFVKLQCHPKCPNLTGWYLEVPPDAHKLVECLHRSVTIRFTLDFGQDPHLFGKDGELKTDIAAFVQPIVLGAKWLEMATNACIDGHTLYVNKNGGIFPDFNPKPLDEVLRDRIIWPEEKDKNEIITISAFPDGKHFYLKSNKKRIFSPEKYDSLNEAVEAAKKTNIFATVEVKKLKLSDVKQIDGD